MLKSVGIYLKENRRERQRQIQRKKEQRNGILEALFFVVSYTSAQGFTICTGDLKSKEGQGYKVHESY